MSLDDVVKSGPQVHAAIAEVEAYTDLDRAGGVQSLLDALKRPSLRAQVEALGGYDVQEMGTPRAA